MSSTPPPETVLSRNSSDVTDGGGTFFKRINRPAGPSPEASYCTVCIVKYCTFVYFILLLNSVLFTPLQFCSRSYFAHDDFKNLWSHQTLGQLIWLITFLIHCLQYKMSEKSEIVFPKAQAGVFKFLVLLIKCLHSYRPVLIEGSLLIPPSFTPLKGFYVEFFLIRIEDLRTEGIICWTDCEALTWLIAYIEYMGSH